jgi:hypothetical protein
LLELGIQFDSSCHCGACQVITSSAFSIGLVVPAQSFELSDPEGLLKIYEDSDPVTLAGNRIAFCGKCGCYLMHEPVFLDPSNHIPPLLLSSCQDFVFLFGWRLMIDGCDREYENYDRDSGPWNERFCQCSDE